MERDLRPFVRPVSKGRFLNVTCLCVENLANLKLETAVVQQRRLRGLILYLSCGYHSPLYIIRCTPFKGARSLHIYPRGGFRGYVYPGITIAVAYVYISTGVGRLHVAYPHEGAMRRPDDRDRRGEIHTPTSFLFP